MAGASTELKNRAGVYLAMSAWPVALSAGILSLVSSRQHYVDLLLKCPDAGSSLHGADFTLLALGPLGLALPVGGAPYWTMTQALIATIACVLLINLPVLLRNEKRWVATSLGVLGWLVLGFLSAAG